MQDSARGPPSTIVEIFQHVSAESPLNISPSPSDHYYNPYYVIFFLSAQTRLFGGGGRGKFPKFLSLLNSSIFVIWEPMQKNWTTVTATCRLFPFSLANIGLFGEGGPQNLFLIGIPLSQ